MFHPTRGGNRGGQGLFQWDDVKSDQHRENYLGHSIKASVGRWQRGKDLEWFNKESGASAEVQQQELDEIRRLEEEAMAEALGGHVKRRVDQSISRQEIKRLIPQDLGAEEFDAKN
nr:hypothetical protein HK105_002513 [Polyrhizophydium stewartii]